MWPPKMADCVLVIRGRTVSITGKEAHEGGSYLLSIESAKFTFSLRVRVRT